MPDRRVSANAWVFIAFVLSLAVGGACAYLAQALLEGRGG